MFNILCRAMSHKINLVLGKRFRGVAPLILVTGYPKSGTTWACQIAADYLELPFPRYNLLPTACPAVIHGHETLRTSFPQVLYVMRDGRDVMVSLYFYLLRGVAPGDRLPRRLRYIFPVFHGIENVRKNLPAFIEHQAVRPHSAPLNWSRHVLESIEYASNGRPILRYEDLLNDGKASLASAMEQLTGNPASLERAGASMARYTFSRQSAKSMLPGGAKGFMREGKAGDWRNYFTREAAEIFAKCFSEGLVAGKYETDDRWVEDVNIK
jgi:hypothetical protein